MNLSINIDHVATLRNARGGNEPDPAVAALICERAGADGIVCHLREDRRHIRDEDLKRLRRVVNTKLDLEMAMTDEIIAIALRIKPDLVTLVPERRLELTTEGGMDVARRKKSIAGVIDRFRAHGIPVSLFIDPDPRQILSASEAGSACIELHTGDYADASTTRRRLAQLGRLREMTDFARSLGLEVNAGHGLDYRNIGAIRAISGIAEVSIGHAVVVRAVSVGLEEAVREMVRLVKGKLRGAMTGNRRLR